MPRFLPVLHLAKLRHLVFALRCLRDGAGAAYLPFRFEGDEADGFFFCQDANTHTAAVWKDSGLVAIEYDKHHDLWSECDRDPEARSTTAIREALHGLPPELEPLRERLERSKLVAKVASRGFWMTDGAASDLLPDEAGHLPHLAACWPTTEHTIEAWDAWASWAQGCLPSEKELALRLFVYGEGDRLRGSDEALLLSPWADPSTAPPAQPENAALCAQHLAQVGVRWYRADARFAAVAGRVVEAKQAAMPPADRELLLAAEHGDVERARAALAAGADPNCRAPQGLYRVSDRPTPTVLAITRGGWEVAECLLLAGADVNLGHGPMGWSLLEATQTKRAKETALVLKHGAELPRGGEYWMGMATCPEVVELVLAAGMPTAGWVPYLADRMRSMGANDLAERIERGAG